MTVTRQTQLEKATAYLLEHASGLSNPGLFNGKTGICIYFFHLAAVTGNLRYREFAVQLWAETSSGLNTVTSVDLEDGLAGIGWGIEYLVRQKYLRPDPEDLLRMIDDKLFKELSFGILDQHERHIHQLIGITFYLLARIKRQVGDSGKENRDLQEYLLCIIVNMLESVISTNRNILTEPPLFNLGWYLPVFLVLLREMEQVQGYRAKIRHIVDGLSPYVLSCLPVLHSHRLALALGIRKLDEHLRPDKWQQHALLLERSIDWKILTGEFRNKSIDVGYGLTGVLFLLNELEKYTGTLLPSYRKGLIVNKIIHSELWNDPVFLSPRSPHHMGLFSGLSGLALGIILKENMQ